MWLWDIQIYIATSAIIQPKTKYYVLVEEEKRKRIGRGKGRGKP